jgi:hypothetical protein
VNAHLNAQIADVLDRAELGDAAEDAVGRSRLPLILCRHTINLEYSFIFDHSGH